MENKIHREEMKELIDRIEYLEHKIEYMEENIVKICRSLRIPYWITRKDTKDKYVHK